MFVYVVFILFYVCVCIRILHVGWLLWLLVGAWVRLCFACRFICSLLPLLRMCFAVTPCAMPFVALRVRLRANCSVGMIAARRGGER